MSREQRRQEGIDTIRAAIEQWAGDRDASVHSNETPIPFADLAERLFDLQPGYCPYDCSNCHDDECPCPDCTPEPCCASHDICNDGEPCNPVDHALLCCADCPAQGD